MVEKLTNEQLEQALNENPKLTQVLMERKRYQQDCRKKSMDLAVEEWRMIGLTPPETVFDIANRYYSWLTEILPKDF